ncbi:unnamed protein product [Vitrella brassicaformis CCMP3155]|uniref:Receptor expression-enhancing protein n=1 Tax=Vitrella brassicaformis (strain CCMP3155) TaxID=1169540 RepID=A0A0G4GK38_VITBC|nr:unnamed protein product [Vitrella brassicaformis CCMP3155]|eukprot:CEM30261.1 unnamed protein product [Vitrella brassicaformis CCMP3155]
MGSKKAGDPPSQQQGGQAVMKPIRDFCDQIDLKMSKNQQLASLCNQIGVRPHVIVLTACGALLAFLLFGIGGNIICNAVGFVYPAWQSFKAIESDKKDDDKLWLTYWVVYGFFSVIEVFADYILFWVPFYWMMKLGFLVWLFLPQTQGSIHMYNNLVKPILTQNQGKIEQTMSKVTGSAGQFLNEAQNMAGHLSSLAAGATKSD